VLLAQFHFLAVPPNETSAPHIKGHKPSIEKIPSRISKTFAENDNQRLQSEGRPVAISPPSSTTQPLATMSSTTQSVACFGKKRTATAVAIAKNGKGLST
jgi:hypothetical protein